MNIFIKEAILSSNEDAAQFRSKEHSNISDFIKREINKLIKRTKKRLKSIYELSKKNESRT